MNTTTPIEPDEVITKKTAVAFTVTCRSLELFKTATFIINLLDIDKNIINTQYITLTNEQYLEWNNNDQYIIDLVASILKVTPI